MTSHNLIHPSLLFANSNFKDEMIELGISMGFKNEDDFLTWIHSTPRYSTLRINKLKTNRSEFIIKMSQFLDNQLSVKKNSNFKIYPDESLDDVVIVESFSLNNVTNPDNNLGDVIVDVNCGSAILRGSDVFVPGIIGLPINLQKNDHVNVYANLKGRCLKGSDSKLFDGSKFFLGIGKSCYSRDELFKSGSILNGVGITMLNNLLPSFNTNFPELFLLQNYPSILASHMLNPQRDEMILDMCAAPGGKTTHIAMLMQNTGIVVAFDKSKQKIQSIENLCSNFGITNVKCFVQDGTKVSKEADTFENLDKLKMGPFDRIMVDAPCSALGQRPKLKITMTSKELKSFPILQRKLLSVAIDLLKPGGRLIFSTCTINPQENQNNVQWIQDNKSMMIHNQTRIFGYPSKDLEEVQSDTIGFFISSFNKVK